MIMLKLFVTQSRSYDEAIDNLDEIKEVIGGSTRNAAELNEMIGAFSNQIISRAFAYPAYTFSNESIYRLISQPGYDGLAIYFVIFENRITVALIALDKNEQPVIVKFYNPETKTIEEGVLGEEDGTGHPRPKVEALLEILQNYSKEK